MGADEKYPLMVDAIYGTEDGDVHGFWSKGHHDPDAFLREVQARHPRLHAEMVTGAPQHGWWRMVPAQTVRVDSRVVGAVPHTRGAFPVTWVADSRFEPGGPTKEVGDAHQV